MGPGGRLWADVSVACSSALRVKFIPGPARSSGLRKKDTM